MTKERRNILAAARLERRVNAEQCSWPGESSQQGVPCFLTVRACVRQGGSGLRTQGACLSMKAMKKPAPSTFGAFPNSSSHW